MWWLATFFPTAHTAATLEAQLLLKACSVVSPLRRCVWIVAIGHTILSVPVEQHVHPRKLNCSALIHPDRFLFFRFVANPLPHLHCYSATDTKFVCQCDFKTLLNKPRVCEIWYLIETSLETRLILFSQIHFDGNSAKLIQQTEATACVFFNQSDSIKML